MVISTKLRKKKERCRKKTEAWLNNYLPNCPAKLLINDSSLDVLILTYVSMTAVFRTISVRVYSFPSPVLKVRVMRNKRPVKQRFTFFHPSVSYYLNTQSQKEMSQPKLERDDIPQTWSSKTKLRIFIIFLLCCFLLITVFIIFSHDHFL